MRRIMLAVIIGFIAALGIAPASPATANLAAPQCQLDDPTWQVSWTSEDAVTLRECGGQGGWSTGADDGGKLPVTGANAGLAAAGAAIALVGLGAGVRALARRRRTIFTV